MSKHLNHPDWASMSESEKSQLRVQNSADEALKAYNNREREVSPFACAEFKKTIPDSVLLSDQAGKNIPPHALHALVLQIFATLKDDYVFCSGPEVPNGHCWYQTGTTSNGLTQLIPIEPEEESRVGDMVLDLVEQCFNPKNAWAIYCYASALLPTGGEPNAPALAKIARDNNRLSKDVTHNIQLTHCVDTTNARVPGYYTSHIPTWDQIWAMAPGLRDSNLTRYDFLDWFADKAEMDAMSLLIGRACTGPQKAILAGQTAPLKHSFRQCGVIVGKPLIGKSFMNDWLCDGMMSLGMRTAPMQPLTSTFGHGSWVPAAWAYTDDTTEEMLDAAYNSGMIKTVCSSGILKVEDKGENAYAAKALAVMVFLANDLSEKSMSKADSGNAQRVWHLASKSIRGCTPLGYTLEDWCEKYNCEERHLCYYLLRACTDYFNSFDLIQLIDKVSQISERLHYGMSKNSLNKLALASIWSYIAITQEPWNSIVEQLSITGNNTDLICKMIQAYCKIRTSDRTGPVGLITDALEQDWLDRNCPVDHPWSGFMSFGYKTIEELSHVAAREATSSSPPKQRFKALFEGLCNTKGTETGFSTHGVYKAFYDAVMLEPDACQHLTKDFRQYQLDDLNKLDQHYDKRVNAIHNPDLTGPYIKLNFEWTFIKNY